MKAQRLHCRADARVISSLVIVLAVGSTGLSLLHLAEPLLITLSVFLLGGGLIRAEYLRRKAEHHRARHESDFVATFEQAAVGLAHVSTTGHFLKTNERLSDILGYSKEDFLTLTFAEITYPEDLDSDLEHFQKVLRGEQSRYATEKRYYRKDGSLVWTNLTVALLRSPRGEPKYFISVIEDISERKRAQEELKAASEAKNRFISIISHELRAPLTPVLAALSGEDGERVDLNDPAVISMMRRNIEHETSIINDLLDLTRISTSGKLQLKLQPVDLHQLIHETLRSLEPSLREHGLALHLELNATRTMVNGDPIRLRQILLNLLENAIKFTPSGGEITLRTRDTGRNGACEEGVDIEVSDTGIGIPPHEAERIFAPFEQIPLPSGKTRGPVGLGLGLAIVKGLVEAHGGRIEHRPLAQGAQGAQGTQGTCFGFNLCLSRPDSPLHGEAEPASAATAIIPPAAGQTSEALSCRPPLHQLRILLVEDHEDTRITLQRLLAKRGHRVTPTTSLAEAISAFKRHRFHLVISDIGLPDGSGLSLPHALATAATANRPPAPCIALSGYGSSEDVEKSYRAGFVRHLTKPVGMHDLDLAIQAVTPLPPPPPAP